jgi:hypothetical protein
MEDGALVGVVGALVENPAVQQHVLRLVDVQIDGVAANIIAGKWKSTGPSMQMQVRREMR